MSEGMDSHSQTQHQSFMCLPLSYCKGLGEGLSDALELPCNAPQGPMCVNIHIHKRSSNYIVRLLPCLCVAVFFALYCAPFIELYCSLVGPDAAVGLVRVDFCFSLCFLGLCVVS